ncbi:MAG TPA: PEGA domain-containing protein [Candidatus Dormibacteraeota bacterium]|nr:PEGA domain-containing protein [Candidatus Dormibacteraeota bacterium]
MFNKTLWILAYLLAAVVIAAGTILLVAYGNGYSYNFKAGRLVRNGLVIFETLPNGASVQVDGRVVKHKTPYRKTFEAGTYKFVLKKEGYRSWQKDIRMVASEVSLHQYILLLPDKFESEPIVTHESIGRSAASPDRRRLAYTVVSGPEAGLWVMDTGNKSRLKAYALQPAAEGTGIETVEELQWSKDNSHILVKSVYSGKPRYLMVAANGSDPAINITDQLKFDFASLTMNPSNWRELYWMSPEGLRRIDLSAQTISAVIAQHAAAFAPADDKVIYIDTSTPSPTLQSVDRGGQRRIILKQLTAGSRYQLATGSFRGEVQIGILVDSNLWVVKNALRDKKTRLALAGVDGMLFSPEGRFISTAAGNRLVTYDIEKSQVWQFESASAAPSNVAWLSEYYLLYVRDGHTIISEYDGANAASLGPASGLVHGTGDSKEVIISEQLNGRHQLSAIGIR